MKDPRTPPDIYDHIYHWNKQRLDKQKRQNEQRKKLGLPTGSFKFKKSRGANSAEMYKGK